MSLILSLNEREVEVTDLAFEAGEFAYVEGALWTDVNGELTDYEIDLLNAKYSDRIYQWAYEEWVSAAEAQADAMEDR